MKTTLEYKGYIGKVDFDVDAGVIHGEVIGTRDVITFQGQSVPELVQAFHDSVDDYLEFCAERGESPDKPFSGQFMTRVDPELHRQVNLAAATEGLSQNAWVSKALEEAADKVFGRLVAPRKAKARSRPQTARRPARKKESEQLA